MPTPVAAAKPLPDTPADATTRLDYDDAEEQEEEQVDTTMEDVPSSHEADGAAQEEEDDADEEEEEAGEQCTPVRRRCRLNTSVLTVLV